MSPFIQYSLVRIRKIQFPEQDYDGWKVNKRKPEVGDTGTLIDILEVPGFSKRYVVESSGTDGITIFLSEFDAEEIEQIRNENGA